MEASPSSLNYLRVAQQLQKKTDELERVFDEARRLEREKTALMEENAALRQEMVQLEAQNRDWRAEFGVLEQQVKKQQQHLQEHIEREAARLQQTGAEEREGIAAKESLLRRLKAAEEAEASGAEALARCRGLSREVAELKRELKAERAKAAHYRSACTRAEADTAAVDHIERKALQGVKGELTSFAVENERLINELEAERSTRRALEERVESLQLMLQRQREVNERQQQLAKQELQALNMQNDTLLEDMKQLMAQYEEDGGHGRNGRVCTRRPPVSSNPCREFSVDRGTQTTEVIYPNTSPLYVSPRAAVRLEPTTVKPAATPEEQNVTIRCDDACPRSARVSSLLTRVRELEKTVEEQALIIREKVSNERLLEERAALLDGERCHLRAMLDRKGMLENSADHHSKDNILRAVADTELSAVLEAVVDVLQLLVQCSRRLRTRLFVSPASPESTVLPVVPCREYSSPHLNAIFSHLGGMRHVVTVIDEIGLRKFTEQQKQVQKKNTDIFTPPKASGGRDSTTHCIQSPKSQHLSNAPPTTTTVRDITTWLNNRRNYLQQQLVQSVKPRADNAPFTPSQNYNTRYTAGETLLDAANQLRSHS